MNRKRANRDAAYDTLIGAYYGGHRTVRHPVASRWLAHSAEELLGGYYGRPRHHAHRTKKPEVHPAPFAGSVATSVDDGATLRSAGGDGGAQDAQEEYVVPRFSSDALAQSLADDSRGGDAPSELEEYVVERAPMDSLSGTASLSDWSADAQYECQVDVLSPLAAPTNPQPSFPAAAPRRAADAAAPAPTTSSAASRSAPTFAAAASDKGDAGAATDDDFMADMQAILSGQSQYDQVSKKTVPKSASNAAPPAPATANSQEIFDRIAASMQFANTYDLGTVELENRFADFDRGWDAEQKIQQTRRARGATGTTPGASKPASPASPATATAPSQTPLATETATTEDFIQDLDSLRRDALERSGVMPRAADDEPRASFAMDNPTALDGAFVTRALQTLFANASDINAYFAKSSAPDFIGWFNTNLAGKGAWAKKAVGTSAQTRANFNAIWDRIPQIFGAPQIHLLQFVSLMSAIINETGDTLGPVSELVGTKDHPGLSYAFDSIPGLKRSYNADGSNWTAYRCFNDPVFLAAHGQKALGDRLANTTDQAWAGRSYPTGYPTAVDPAKTGFVMEADFYKFRGRGLIQTTWRDGYLALIRYVQAYSGTSAVISARTNAWATTAPDAVASASANADWDDLFMRTNLEIPCVAIAQHSARSGNYLNLSGDVNVLNGGDVSGSIWRMGHVVRGGAAEADLFRDRVVAICNLLNN